ncbi:gamma-glutamyl-gamma-aminobutyrate hydrolase family protein [Campylobacter sp. VicNov18]|uniref:gamma-glutamyl-CDP-amidate hydrolase n=1 Tax=Campylobacter bilis TaxID=2691918 RepID=UPI00130E35ED|nr:gamma-glutamyl-CDP-amidate hydrolase [Campylobacter bilis]MPV64266.1 gamma-glutamyl-gamma-aminobutyrate hydrolase family protein [Campylobacter hepaticus]MBM0637772.1 gamma-glutamyl-gamma-aminobutyrate hydrolase family protein [Campylobacter bilis]MCC8278498.1 gamma-glutamyl-gamma-aminobutyrate hydrolase family protein [Campylobacter bilis]MCC8300001.1 gamma-glutamyl-gamma-aminobutyrate hydrolase family protein [Campylobacter bilis]MCC8301407.1 gamma-glutamyl-gamma-aminobutyrate hydrolase f
MFIGITQRLICNENYHEERECLALDWGKLFNQPLFRNFTPIPLSYEINFLRYKHLLKAVILSGGNDLSLYNSSILSKKRDLYEQQIIKICLEDNIPLLGICRGAQIIAHYFNSYIVPCNNHIGEHEIFSLNQNFISNSFHNFAIKQLGEDLVGMCFAKDDTIEAFKHKRGNIFGIMWHIEREKGLNNIEVLKEWLNLIKE